MQVLMMYRMMYRAVPRPVRLPCPRDSRRTAATGSTPVDIPCASGAAGPPSRRRAVDRTTQDRGRFANPYSMCSFHPG